MNPLQFDNALCHICFCAGRKLTQLNGFYENQIYLDILNDAELKPEVMDGYKALICWECHMVISKFVKFKMQVVNSHRTLQYYIRQNLDLSQLRREPRLKIHKGVVEYLYPQAEDLYALEEVKIENIDWESKSPTCRVNEEDNLSFTSGKYSDEDDQKLSILSENILKKKKVKAKKDTAAINGHKKKRKKKDSEEYRVIKLDHEKLSEERNLAASLDNYLNSEHKCERCIITFPNSLDLRDHVVNKHNTSNPYKCTICECTFISEILYNYHMNKHERRYQCIVCVEIFKSKRLVGKHYQNIHIVRKMSCDICEFIFSTEEELVSHRISHDEGGTNGSRELETDLEIKNQQTNGQTYPCGQCNKVFRWKTSLRKHAETHRIQAGEKRTPYCDACKISFTTTSNLQKHMKTSSKHQIQLKLRKLKENQDTPDTETALKVEEIKRDITDSLNKYSCPHCERRFQWRGNLARHVKSHRARAAGELKCLPCSRSFSSIATYRQHMTLSRRHVAEADFRYVCSECGKRFANKTRLKDHVDWEHLKNYVHTCPICKKVFKSHTSLYLHGQAVHRRGGEHLCDHCGKPFQNRNKLRSHIVAMHTNEQPYRCPICAAAFSWHSCLSRHVKVVHHKVKVKRRRAKREDN